MELLDQMKFNIKIWIFQTKIELGFKNRKFIRVQKLSSEYAMADGQQGSILILNIFEPSMKLEKFMKFS